MSAKQLIGLKFEAVGFLNAPNAKGVMGVRKPKKRVTHAAKRASAAFRIVAAPVTPATKLSSAKGTPKAKQPDTNRNGTPNKRKGKGKKSTQKAKLERATTVDVTEKEARLFVAGTKGWEVEATPARTLTALNSNPGTAVAN